MVDTPRVIIVGAGPAGTRAAETLVRHGIRPLMVDEALQGGGQIYRRQPPSFHRTARKVYGFEAARATRLHAAFDAIRPAIDYRPATVIWNATGDALYATSCAGGPTERLPYDSLILATGAADRVIPFPGWTTAGVYTLGAAQIALKYQACAIGSRVAFVGTGPLLYLVAYQYMSAGAKVTCVLDTTPFGWKMRVAPRLLASGPAFAKGLYYMARLRLHGVPMVHGIVPVAVRGASFVEGLAWRGPEGGEQVVECDAIGLGYGVQSETQLADLLGCDFTYEPRSRQWLPVADEDGRTSRGGIYVAGDGRRVRGADFAEAAGELAALALLSDREHKVDEARVEWLRRRMVTGLRWAEALQDCFPVPHEHIAGLPDETILCRCEAITAGELRATAREVGSREINRSKALSRVGMGRCQGRYCGLSAVTLLAEETGCAPSEIGRLRGQAPLKPIPIRFEAAG
jgi:NADPH-dependent 2,4-dienoyl-CoA reductase/sulfur reductase-like enzyme